MNATHKLTIVEPVNFAEIAKSEAAEKEALEYLDWSFSLLIESTDLGFKQLLRQLEQAKRHNCTEAEFKIEERLMEKYEFNYRIHLDECKPDTSSADGSAER